MNTNLEIVSRVENLYKTINKDQFISRRFILRTAQDKARFLISQKLRDRSLYMFSNIYKELPCLELEPVEVIKCPIVEFKTCRKLMKSKKKLPGLIYSRLGASIKEITTIDGSNPFVYTTPYKYNNNKKRQDSSFEYTYYEQDGILYFPDTEIETVRVLVATTNVYELEKICGCSSSDCKSVWDFEFVCPDNIFEAVIQETIKELAINKQIPEDENPNMNEQN